MTAVTITHIGGPTALIEFGGWRILTDPTFDPPGKRYFFGWGTMSSKLFARGSVPAALSPTAQASVVSSASRWGAVSWARAPAMGGCRRGRFRQSLGGRVWCWCCRMVGERRARARAFECAHALCCMAANRSARLQATACDQITIMNLESSLELQRLAAAHHASQSRGER